VISEIPAAGTTVSIGSSVNLVVSSGLAQVVPNVVGEAQAIATAEIAAAGLTVGTITPESSGTVPSGYVISESPTAGTPVSQAICRPECNSLYMGRQYRRSAGAPDR
jgi:beta-lactam-binding protein with PASTA domain